MFNDDPIRFEVKPEHLKLIKKQYVSYNDYCEFGAPEINPKRPYGNSDVYSDIAEILDIFNDEDRCFTEEQERYMLKLHKETTDVLQILISTGSIKVGIYEREDRYSKSSWEYISGYNNV